MSTFHLINMKHVSSSAAQPPESPKIQNTIYQNWGEVIFKFPNVLFHNPFRTDLKKNNASDHKCLTLSLSSSGI